MWGRRSLVLALAFVAGCDVVFRLDDLHDGGVVGDGVRPIDDVPLLDAPLDPRIIARFDFEGTFDDAKSNMQAQCVSSTCPHFKVGKHGMGLDLDGLDDCLRFPLSTNPTQLTLMAWVYKTLDTGQSVVSKPYMATSSDTYQIDVESNQNVRFITYNGSGDRILTQTSGITLNAWNHIAVTFEGNTKRLYINGMLAQTSIGETMVSDGSAMLIGCDHETSLFARYFVGALDEVILFNVGLASYEIEMLATP